MGIRTLFTENNHIIFNGDSILGGDRDSDVSLGRIVRGKGRYIYRVGISRCGGITVYAQRRRGIHERRGYVDGRRSVGNAIRIGELWCQDIGNEMASGHR